MFKVEHLPWTFCLYLLLFITRDINIDDALFAQPPFRHYITPFAACRVPSTRCGQWYTCTRQSSVCFLVWKGGGMGALAMLCYKRADLVALCISVWSVIQFDNSVSDIDYPCRVDNLCRELSNRVWHWQSVSGHCVWSVNIKALHNINE